MCLVAAPRSTHQPGVPAPPLLEFPDVPLNPAQNGRVREFDPALAHPIHQIARTQFVTEYHLTHRMMTCWSKCRPLNRSVSAAVIYAIMPVQPTFRVCTRTLSTTNAHQQLRRQFRMAFKEPLQLRGASLKAKRHFAGGHSFRLP